MKRYLILLLSCLTAIVSYSQSQLDRAFYIYRNDGIFNAFYYSEVDSITYSFYDQDNIEHNSVVTQEVWTSDSIYRIPLNVIDSVSFVKPETSYKANVIRLDEKYNPYIIFSDSLSVKFAQDLPENLIPNKNDILLYEGFSDLFPNGFVGRVNSVSNDLVVKCDSVEFEDVYDELILLGDYVLTEDAQNAREYRLVPHRIAGEVPLAISFQVNRSFGPITLQGSITQGIKLRIVARLQRGIAPYIELQVKDEELLDIEVKASAKVSGFRQVGDKLFGVSVPIPGCMGLKFNYATSPFIKPELKAETSFGFEMNSRGQTSYIYDGNGWKTVQKPRVSERKITAKTGFNGSLWFGVVECFHIATIKDFLSIGTDIYIGPKISGNVDINIGDGVPTTSMYETLKDTKVDLSLRVESDIAFRWRLSRNNSGYTPLFNIIPGIEWYIGERYLFPLFTKPECNVSNAKVDVSSEISRPLLLPCIVGYRLSNSGETIDTHYNERTYWNDDDYSAPLNTTFTGFKYNKGKYKVCPMVRVLGWEVEARPETEFNYGLYVYTGGATASFTEAMCWGGASLNDDSNKDVASITDECGFFYNMTGAPQNGNAAKQICSMGADGSFDGILSGLTEDTQYYYTAFVKVGEDFYYGDPGSFKTKKKDDPDPDPDPNPNPDPDPDPEPIAITGTHYGETTTSAVVVCTYKNVPQGASCRVEYSSSGAYASSGFVANGSGDGTRSVTISGLKPNTEYTYCAYIELADKSSVYGVDSTFTTKALPIPIAITGDNYDISSSTGTIECTYQNIEEGAESWCLVTESGTSNQQIYEFGSFEGTKITKLSNLKPSTTYIYKAYVDYEGETYEAQNGSKSFTTLTPGAYVKEADEEKITTTSAQFEYGFSNVPQNGNCYIAIQAENDESYYYYSVSDTDKDIYEFSGLQPSTTYSYWAYVELDGAYWNSNSESFTTKALPIPSAITGEVSDVTDKSANVECTFSNVPDGGVCGVEFTWNGGSTKQTSGGGDGTRTISLGGLKPNTTYTYCAYVEANGTTYYGEDKTFTTDLPDISGTWSCTEHHVRANGSTYDTSYSLTLGKDGKVQYSESAEIYSSSWSFSRNGTVTVSIMDLATQYANSGKGWEGTVDNIENPTKITGGTYRWNYNQIGYFQGDSVSFEMTR